MAEDTEDRSEEPTAKRRTQAKEKGQAPRSRDLNTMLLLLTMAAGLYMAGSRISAGMQALFVRNLSIARDSLFDPQAMVSSLYAAAQHALIVISPFLLMTLVVALVAPMLSGSWLFSWSALTPNFGRMNPVSGLKRLFGLQGWFEMAKAFLKFSLVIGVAFFVIRAQFQSTLNLINLPFETGIALSARLMSRDLLLFSAVTVLIAAADVPYQWWSHTRKLKMSKQEVKDEVRETEGKPEVKARIRRVQQEIARRRMMQAVPKADVIVTNPSHYAVALRYDAKRMRAPRVVAKGTDDIAFKIRTVGVEHRVPVVSAPPLARALYFSTKLDAEIPEGLYVAVAQLLAYVVQLKLHGTVDAKELNNLPIPPELRRDI